MKASPLIRLLPGLIAVAIFLAGPAGAEGLPHLKLGIVKLGAMTNVWFAAREGIFKKHGLDVELVDVPLTDQAVGVLQSKSVDIVLSIPGSAMAAKEQGFDLVLVGQNETAGSKAPVSNAILVRANSPVRTIKDLKGKKIGSGSPRGQSYAAVKELFARNGLSSSDVDIIEAPFTAHADLLRSGQVDAVVALNPYTTQIVKAGYGRVLSWYMMETIPDQPVGAWWALSSWAQQHKDQIAAFQDAVQESHAYLNANPERAKKLVAEYAGLDLGLVQDMPLISWRSQIVPSVWQAVADMMYRRGELEHKHDVSEYLQYTPRYVGR